MQRESTPHTCPLLVGSWQRRSHLSQRSQRHPSTTISEILWVIGVPPTPSSFSVPGSPAGNLLTFNGHISSASSDLCYFFRLSLLCVTLMVLRAGYFVQPRALVLADIFLMLRLGYGFWKEDHKGEVCIHSCPMTHHCHDGLDHLADRGRVRQAPPRSCHPSDHTVFFRGMSQSRAHTRQVVPLPLLQGAYLHEVGGILLSG